MYYYCQLTVTLAYFPSRPEFQRLTIKHLAARTPCSNVIVCPPTTRHQKPETTVRKHNQIRRLSRHLNPHHIQRLLENTGGSERRMQVYIEGIVHSQLLPCSVEGPGNSRRKTLSISCMQLVHFERASAEAGIRATRYGQRRRHCRID